MSADSHRDLIVAAIRVSSQPLDDDQLAARTGISPRQTVNQACRALERAGMVRRRPGPDGKIVNEWLGERAGNPQAPQARQVRVVSLPDDLGQRLLEAQHRQYR